MLPTIKENDCPTPRASGYLFTQRSFASNGRSDSQASSPMLKESSHSRKGSNDILTLNFDEKGEVTFKDQFKEVQSYFRRSPEDDNDDQIIETVVSEEDSAAEEDSVASAQPKKNLKHSVSSEKSEDPNVQIEDHFKLEMKKAMAKTSENFAKVPENQIQIHEPSTPKTPDNNRKKQRRNMGSLRGRPTPFRSLQKLARKVIHLNERAKRMSKSKSRSRLFVEKYEQYIRRMLEIMLDLRDDRKASLKRWQHYANSSLFTLIGLTSESLLPVTPLSFRAVDSWSMLALLSFYKFSRPDLMYYCLQVLYPDIKSPVYFEVPNNLLSSSQIEWFKKPTLVMFGRLFSNPTQRILDIAQSRKIKTITMDLNQVHMDKFIADFVSSSSKGVWLILTNLQLISREKSVQILKSILQTISNPYLHKRYKCWIMYPVSRYSYDPDFHTEESSRYPEWFSSCYKIYYNHSSNIFGEIMSLYNDEVNKHNISLKTDTELDKAIANSAMIKSKSIYASDRASDRTPMVPEEDSPSKKGLKESVLVKSSSRMGTGFQHEEINLYDKILIERQKEGDFNSGSFRENHEKEIIFKLKFIFGLLRQREPKIDQLQQKRFKYIEMHLSDKIINSMIDRCISIVDINIEEQFNVIFKYLLRLFFPHEMINCYLKSPILFHDFFDKCVYKSTSRSLMMKFGRQKYMLPGSGLTKLEFTKVFKQCLKKYPYMDNPSIMGLHHNEEKVIDHSLSKKSFKLLSTYFNQTKIGDEKENYLDQKAINLFIKLNKGSQDDIIDSAVVDSIEYAMEITAAFEKHDIGMKQASSLITDILGGFSSNVFAFIEEKLLGHRVMITESKEPSQSPLKTARTKKGALRLAPSEKDLEPSGTVLSENRSPSVTIASNKESSRDQRYLLQYKKNFMLHEFRVLKKLIGMVLEDLYLAKYYVGGMVNHRNKQRAIRMLKSISRNEIPEEWIEKLAPYNLNVRDFRVLIKDIMLRYDNLYYLVISLEGVMPPILGIHKLLDPSSFLINAALFSNLKYRVSLLICFTVLFFCFFQVEFYNNLESGILIL